MGSFSGESAVLGLSATGTGTGINVAMSGRVGVAPVVVSLTNATVAYSFSVTSTGVGDVATLTISSGVVAQTTGTPTISGGAGKDFEGISIPSMTSLYGLLLQTSTGNTDNITVASSAGVLPDITLSYGANPHNVLVTYTEGSGGIPSETIAFTFAASGDTVTATILAA